MNAAHVVSRRHVGHRARRDRGCVRAARGAGAGAGTAKPAAVAKGKPWVVPRTPDGKPDLQGNWSNETQTPLERMGKQGATLTERGSEGHRGARQGGRRVPRPGQRSESADAGERRRRARADRAGRPSFIERISEAAGGKVGGYNGFWLDPGDKVITIDGVARSSIIVDPPDGRVPALTAEARQRRPSVRPPTRSSASSITRSCGRSPIAACCRSARTPGRRCCRTTSTTTTTRSCRRGIT